MKKYYLFIPLALLLLFSSCSSMRVEKRHYNKGFYVDFGNDKNTEANPAKSEQEEVVTVEVAPQPVQENADRPIAWNTASGDAAQNSSQPSESSDEVANEPTQAASTTTEADEQNDATRAESTKPESALPHGDSDVALILLVILAILLPPLAVYLVEGASTWFWVTLILCLFGGGFFFHPYFGGLWLVAMIIALLVVFGAL